MKILWKEQILLKKYKKKKPKKLGDEWLISVFFLKNHLIPYCKQKNRCLVEEGIFSLGRDRQVWVTIDITLIKSSIFLSLIVIGYTTKLKETKKLASPNSSNLY